MPVTFTCDKCGNQKHSLGGLGSWICPACGKKYLTSMDQEIELEYERSLAAWETLTWWQRLRTKKPELPLFFPRFIERGTNNKKWWQFWK